MEDKTISVSKIKAWIKENTHTFWFDGVEYDDYIYPDDLLEFIEKEAEEE